MDWENKFTSILREAESNLSKTRRKINSTRPFNERHFSMSLPMRRTSSMLDFPRQELYTSVYNPVTENVGTSNGLVQTLSDRLEEQNRLIDQLRQMVNKLETDRNNYGEQIRELKNEVYKLSGRSGSNIDQKLDKVRHDLNQDIHLLNDQLQNLRTTGSNRMSENHYYSLSKDVQDVKHTLRDDMETIKRDVDTVKSRLFKMELDVSSAFNNGKDLQRKHEVLDQNMHDLATYQHKQPYRSQDSWSPTSDNERLHMSELRSQDSLSPTTDNERLHMSELRSTVSVLKDRIGNMEAVVNSQQASPRYSTPIMQNGFHLSSPTKHRTSPKKNQKPVYKTSIKLDNDIDSDDLLLSDDESSDLEIFNPSKQHIKGLDSDDDLDLDDLDLDDDMGSIDSDLNDF